MNDFKFQMGELVTDKITGFTGVIILRSEWISNCNTYGLQPTNLKDNNLISRSDFDEPRLESALTGKDIVNLEIEEKVGGDPGRVEQNNVQGV